MSNLPYYQERYAQCEISRPVSSYLAGSTNAIKSEYGTSSQSMNGIPTLNSQRHGNRELSDAYVKDARPTQPLDHPLRYPQFPLSYQMAHVQTSSQISEMHRLPYPSTANNLLPQPQCLEESSRPPEETAFYANAKQFNRILKRRDARQKLAGPFGYIPGRRRSYVHESRHQHAIRRPRGLGGKFLKRGELGSPNKGVQKNGTTVRCQILETRTGPNINHTKEESADLVADVPTKDKRGNKQKRLPSQFQVHANGSDHISKAITTSFCGAAKLEELCKMYST